MRPTIECGDGIIERRLNRNTVLASGDIIVYYRPVVVPGELIPDAEENVVPGPETYSCANRGDSIVHRIVQVEGDTYITKGDNNHLNDPYKVPRSCVRSVVSEVVRGAFEPPVDVAEYNRLWDAVNAAYTEYESSLARYEEKLSAYSVSLDEYHETLITYEHEVQEYEAYVSDRCQKVNDTYQCSGQKYDEAARLFNVTQRTRALLGQMLLDLKPPRDVLKRERAKLELLLEEIDEAWLQFEVEKCRLFPDLCDRSAAMIDAGDVEAVVNLARPYPRSMFGSENTLWSA